MIVWMKGTQQEVGGTDGVKIVLIFTHNTKYKRLDIPFMGVQ